MLDWDFFFVVVPGALQGSQPPPKLPYFSHTRSTSRASLLSIPMASGLLALQARLSDEREDREVENKGSVVECLRAKSSVQRMKRKGVFL